MAAEVGVAPFAAQVLLVEMLPIGVRGRNCKIAISCSPHRVALPRSRTRVIEAGGPLCNTGVKLAPAGTVMACAPLLRTTFWMKRDLSSIAWKEWFRCKVNANFPFASFLSLIACSADLSAMDLLYDVA